MKIMMSKLHIVLLTVLVGLVICFLANGVPVRHTFNNRKTSDYIVYSRNFSPRHLHVPKSQRPEGMGINTSLPANTRESENWAGYVDTPSSGIRYTSVSGSWKVSSLSTSQENAAAAEWIGLGGSSSPDLLQMGTSQEIENGQPVAKVFWELLPSPAQEVMTVPIGSIIHATISPVPNSSSTWNLKFTVNGRSQSQTIPPVTLSSSYAQGIGTSAEWISEEPLNQNDQPYPFANMGTVSYQSALVDGQALNSAGNQIQPVALVSSNGNVLIAPSALGKDGESFSTSVISTKVNTSSN